MRHLKYARKIQAFGLPMLNTLFHVQQVGAANHVTQSAYAECCHDPAKFFCDEEKEVHDVFGLSFEFLAQLGILRCYADRTSVEMAFTHHDATTHHQRRCSEAELIGTENRADR